MSALTGMNGACAPKRRARGWVHGALLAASLLFQAGEAGAVEIGPLVLRRDIPPGMLGQFRVYDRTPIESSQFTIRLAHADAYTALGLKYDRALSGVSVSIEPTMDSGLTVLLRPLPATTIDNKPLDIVVVIFEGLKLTTRLFRVDLHASTNEFAALDPTEASVAGPARPAPRGAPVATSAAAPAAKPAPAVATLPAQTALGVATANTPVAKPAAPPAPVAGNAGAQVMQVVERWADAWAAREVDAYAATYVPDYRGTHPGHAQWLAFRRSRIMARQSIQIDLSDIAVNVEGNRAEVRFVQKYRGDKTDLTDRKRMVLVRNPAGAWLIQEEATL